MFISSSILGRRKNMSELAANCSPKSPQWCRLLLVSVLPHPLTPTVVVGWILHENFLLGCNTFCFPGKGKCNTKHIVLNCSLLPFLLPIDVIPGNEGWLVPRSLIFLQCELGSELENIKYQVHVFYWQSQDKYHIDRVKPTQTGVTLSLSWV